LLTAGSTTGEKGVAATKILAADDPQTPLGRMLVEQAEQLGSYHWINRETQVRAIPIDRAMQVVRPSAAATETQKPANGGKP